MSTKITALFDALVAKIEATFVGIRRLANPYDLDAAPGVFLQYGYGVAFGPGRDPKQDISCQMQVIRDFSITFTRLVSTTDNNASARGATEKTMFENQLTLIKAINADITLNGIVADVQWQNDTGLQLMTPSDAAGRYYVLTNVFQTRYMESLT